MKLDAMTGPTNGKDRSTSGGDPVPDTDSGSLFIFPHLCTIVNMQSPAAFHETRRYD